MAGPLEGLVVVSLEQAVAIPFATRQLADLGARVIKIERAGEGDFARHYDHGIGPGLSSAFLWLNRGKESIELNVKSEAGRATLHRLVDRADVFLQNLAPGAVERLGCDAGGLRARNPRLITCWLSGYGPDGPYRDRKAYDLLIQAEAGLVSLTGTPDAPAKDGMSAADIAAGMYAYSSTLAALIQRGITGGGAHIQVNLFDCLLEWLGHQSTYARTIGQLPARAGARHATIAPYGPFTCANGSVVLLAVQNDRQWKALCDVLGAPELPADPRFASNPDRVAHVQELEALVSARTAAMAAEELIESLDAAGLPWGRLNDMRDVFEHPQLAARQRWQPVSTPHGSFPGLRSPVDITGVDITMGVVPSLGQHTDSVLAWLDGGI